MDTRLKKIQEKEDAFVIYKFLILYNHFEKLMFEIFDKYWDQIDSDIKSRISYYVGWLGSERKYIDYDSYAIRQEIHKYGKKIIMEYLTVNQIIKIDRKEKMIKQLSFDIPSMVRKMSSISSHSCFLAFLNMRNMLAHKILNINFKEKHTIELLSLEAIKKSESSWITDLNISSLSSQSQNIVSNYMYMDIIVEKLTKVVDDYEQC